MSLLTHDLVLVVFSDGSPPAGEGTIEIGAKIAMIEMAEGLGVLCWLVRT